MAITGSDWILEGGSGQTLRLEEGTASGGAGVNRYSGAYELDEGRLTFGPLVTTRMAGTPEAMEAEQEFLASLASIATAALADDTLVLGDAVGKEILRFTLASAHEEEGSMELVHTCYRITDPDRSVAFYEALGLEKRAEMPIRDEAINIFLGVPGKPQPELELTYNFGVDSYELGTAYGHIAFRVRDLDATLAALAEKGIDPERPPYQVREGGVRICFVRDPDDYRIELIERS
jgi:lactoylglutathione lyase